MTLVSIVILKWEYHSALLWTKELDRGVFVYTAKTTRLNNIIIKILKSTVNMILLISIKLAESIQYYFSYHSKVITYGVILVSSSLPLSCPMCIGKETHGLRMEVNCHVLRK